MNISFKSKLKKKFQGQSKTKSPLSFQNQKLKTVKKMSN